MNHWVPLGFILLAFACPAFPAPALVSGPLHTVTWVTRDELAARQLLVKGLGFTPIELADPIPEVREARRQMWGFARGDRVKEILFGLPGDAHGARIRLLVTSDAPGRVRPERSAAGPGGLGLVMSGIPWGGLAARWQAAGLRLIHTANPDIEQAFGPDNVLLQAVRSEPPLSPPSLVSASIVVRDPDADIGFFRDVLGFTVQREQSVQDARSNVALGLPPDTRVRTVQLAVAQAPGTHLELIGYSSAAGSDRLRRLGAQGEAPARGVWGWTFPVSDILETRRRVLASKGVIVWGPAGMVSAYFGDHKIMTVRSPGGALLELVQLSAR